VQTLHIGRWVSASWFPCDHSPPKHPNTKPIRHPRQVKQTLSCTRLPVHKRQHQSCVDDRDWHRWSTHAPTSPVEQHLIQWHISRKTHKQCGAHTRELQQSDISR
jgi:hypothetical protein